MVLAQGTTASSEITREINMAQVNTDSNKGTISVTPNNFAFLVDDIDAVDYVAVLTATAGAELAITFTPATGADASLATNGISMVATVTVATTAAATTYTGIDSAGDPQTVVPLAAKTDGNANVITITGNGVDGTTKITAAQILGALVFNEGKDIKLPTKADNDRYHNVLKDYTIKITISEVVA